MTNDRARPPAGTSRLSDQLRLRQMPKKQFPGHNKTFPCGIMGLPVELTIKIFKNLDLESAFRLSETCKRLREDFKAHQEVLVLSILAVELRPFDNLLQCIVQKGEDLTVPLGPCLRRRIYHRGKLVSEGEVLEPREEGHDLLPAVFLDQEHFRRLVSAYRLVKDWELFFPQYRFRHCLSDCRELRPHEKERLRAALYRWMSYAQYFHGELKRPSMFLPEPRSMDIRCQKLRVLSNVELIELEDLWNTVISIVSRHICPSTEQVMIENDGSLSLQAAERLSFGSSKASCLRHPYGWLDNRQAGSAVNNVIVQTFLKLLPNDVLRFATSRFVYTREKVIREVRLAYPSILQDQQTLGHALKAVITERDGASLADGNDLMRLFYSTPGEGGILDIDTVGDCSDGPEYRKSVDTEGEWVLSWPVETGLYEGGLGTPTDRGRLEP